MVKVRAKKPAGYYVYQIFRPTNPFTQRQPLRKKRKVIKTYTGRYNTVQLGAPLSKEELFALRYQAGFQKIGRNPDTMTVDEFCKKTQDLMIMEDYLFRDRMYLDSLIDTSEEPSKGYGLETLASKYYG